MTSICAPTGNGMHQGGYFDTCLSMHAQVWIIPHYVGSLYGDWKYT